MTLNSSFYSNCWKVFTQIRWNSLATCFRIFSGTIYNVPVLFFWFPGLVYIVFASDTQNMTRPFRNRGKRYLPVYICVSTFDRTGLFETLCLFSSSFSKNFECYYWTLPPAPSPAKKPWERSWDKSTTLLCLGSKLADFFSHTAFFRWLNTIHWIEKCQVDKSFSLMTLIVCWIVIYPFF